LLSLLCFALFIVQIRGPVRPYPVAVWLAGRGEWGWALAILGPDRHVPLELLDYTLIPAGEFLGWIHLINTIAFQHSILAVTA